MENDVSNNRHLFFYLKTGLTFFFFLVEVSNRQVGALLKNKYIIVIDNICMLHVNLYPWYT